MLIETRPISGLQPTVGCSIWLPHDAQQDLFVQQPGQQMMRYRLEGSHWVLRSEVITEEEVAGLRHRIHREDPVAYLAKLESIDDCVYHQSPLDEEELKTDALSHFRAMGDKIEIWTVEHPPHAESHGDANVVILQSDTELDDTPCNILRWYLFDHYYNTQDREHLDEISLVAMGGWSVMRTVYIDWLEIYDHETGFDDVATAMQVVKSVLTHRRNIGHPDSFVYY